MKGAYELQWSAVGKVTELAILKALEASLEGVRLGAAGLAVSGGVDSMLLLELGRGFPAVGRVLHLDHGLRKSSRAAADFVAEAARASGLKLERRRIELGEHWRKVGGSLEGLAREARYAFFAEVAEEHELETILLAHHRDDQIETVALELWRGSGPLGLRGMLSERPLSRDQRCRLQRPFLDFSKRSLQELAERRRVNWQDDESNRDLGPRRNHLRHRTLPDWRAAQFGLRPELGSEPSSDIDPEVSPRDSTAEETTTRSGLAHKARPLEDLVADSTSHELHAVDARLLTLHRRARRTELLVESMAEHIVNGCPTTSPETQDPLLPKSMTLNRQALEAMPRELVRAVVARAGRQLDRERFDPSGRQIALLLDQLAAGALHMPLSPVLTLSLDEGGDLVLARRAERTRLAAAASWSPRDLVPGKTIEIIETGESFRLIAPDHIDFDIASAQADWPEAYAYNQPLPDLLVSDLKVRRAEDGETIRPFGMSGTKSLRDCYAEGRRPTALRPCLAIIADSKGPLWLPGLRASERLRVSEDAVESRWTLQYRRRFVTP